MECTSCKNGDKEFPDWAVWRVTKAPMEARKLHGLSLCNDHATLLVEDYPDARMEIVPEWVDDAERANKEEAASYMMKCPKCGRKAQAVPGSNCGDCLMEHAEIVALKVVSNTDRTGEG